MLYRVLADIIWDVVVVDLSAVGRRIVETNKKELRKYDALFQIALSSPNICRACGENTQLYLAPIYIYTELVLWIKKIYYFFMTKSLKTNFMSHP